MTVPAPSRRLHVVAGLRLVRLVGCGGEGQVWEARDGRGRRRALKLIRPDLLAGDAETRGRWLRRIDHPALVRVHRSGQLGAGPLAGWGFIEMDYVDGASLRDAAADRRFLQRLAPLAEALDLLHDGAWSDGLPLVHGDVKPANLVAGGDGGLVLVDPSTLRGVDGSDLNRLGTPVFVAPEVETGDGGPPADVYSFAVTVVALVTGARGRRLAGLVAGAAAGARPPEGPEGSDLPGGVSRGLAACPADRPGSCRAVLEAAAGPPAVHVPPGAGTGGPWPWLVVLAVAVAVPTLGWALEWLRGPGLVAAAAGAAAGHLCAHVAARRSLLAALVVPPAAWAFLLAERSPGPRRRQAWTRTVLTGALAALAVVLADAVSGARLAGSRHATAVLVVAGLLLVAAGLRAPALRGAAGLLARLVLLPVWLAGAGLLLAAAALAVPLAPPLGGVRPAGWLAPP